MIIVMDLARLLKPELIELEIEIDLEARYEDEASSDTFRWRCKEKVIEQLVKIFVRSDEIRNASKFKKDIIYREKQVSTGIGRGIALPHIRSLQARTLVAIFARSVDGVEYMSLDQKPTHFFFGLTSPPYDDSLYLEAYSWVTRSFKEEFWLHDALMTAQNSEEVLSILHGLQ